MVADVNIKDYYLQFIHDAEADAEEYKNELKTVLKVKETVYEYLDINKENKRISLSIKDAVERSTEYMQYNDDEEGVTLGELFKGLFK